MSGSKIPIPVVCGIIKDSYGRFLISKRKSSPEVWSSGKWEFPGGKVEPGETLDQAIIREIQEELGVVISVEQDHEYHHRHIETPTGSRTLFYLRCHIAEDQKPTAIGCDSFAFVELHELLTFDLLPGDKDVAAMLANKRSFNLLARLEDDTLHDEITRQELIETLTIALMALNLKVLSLELRFD